MRPVPGAPLETQRRGEPRTGPWLLPTTSRGLTALNAMVRDATSHSPHAVPATIGPTTAPRSRQTRSNSVEHP